MILATSLAPPETWDAECVAEMTEPGIAGLPAPPAPDLCHIDIVGAEGWVAGDHGHGHTVCPAGESRIESRDREPAAQIHCRGSADAHCLWLAKINNVIALRAGLSESEVEIVCSKTSVGNLDSDTCQHCDECRPSR